MMRRILLSQNASMMARGRWPWLRSAVFAALLAGLSGVASAQNNICSQNSIKMIVPFAVGSINDILARAVIHEMSPVLGKPIIAENRVGAGGMLATALVAKAAPDGCTLGWATSSQMVTNIAIYKNISFDVDRDIGYVGLVSRLPLALVVRSDSPSSLKDFLAGARRHTDHLSFGSAGVGSISHIVAEAFLRQASVQARHIPYTGNAAALVDLMGGHIDFMFDPMSTSVPLMHQGKIKILALSSANRNSSAPQVPTFAEAGMPAYEAYTWNAIIVPAATPEVAREQLNAALGKALASAAVKKLLEQGGAETLGPSTPHKAAEFAKTERSQWLPLIESLQISVK